MPRRLDSLLAAVRRRVGPKFDALRAAAYRKMACDRRGFGRSDKLGGGHDTIAGRLAGILDDLDLKDNTLVGVSMGVGEVAQYVVNHGPKRLRRVAFAAAMPPTLLNGQGDPDGPAEG